MTNAARSAAMYRCAELLSRCDIVTLHCPLTPDNKSSDQ